MENVVKEADGLVHGNAVVAFVRAVVKDHLDGVVFLDGSHGLGIL